MKMTPSLEPYLEESLKRDEEQKKQDKRDERQRKQREKLEDSSYELKEKQRIKRELGNPKKRQRAPAPMSSKDRAEHDAALQKWLLENEVEKVPPTGVAPTGAPEPAPELQPDVSPASPDVHEETFGPEEPIDTDALLQTDQPEENKCMNALPETDEFKWHANSKANFKLVHNGLLGDMPPITLCEICARLLKVIPVSGESVGKNLIEWPQMQTAKQKKKIRRKKKRKSDIYLRLIKLADNLDCKGFYKDASLIDAIIDQALLERS
jgi:hypothetical protein